ncbi:MATE family efflux transporter [Romboutsia weinsteinii]|uniref:MATE family efflux transporter n=1 Tax=Romboutsia weinsteinii TaxID=2020949 RepID=A0A371J350_9FIRM|nr:MATE family efflux transporter [Romboutsia weinsteinii]RDY27096.1 MATE family efflux transporter [Romboutsia weinsteinii]
MLKTITYNKLEKENELRFIHIFIPILVEQVFQTLIGNVDILLLSQYSDDAVAAVGLSNQIIVIGTMILGVVAIGAVILLTQLLGSNKNEKIKLVIGSSIYLNLVISFIIFMVLLLFGKHFLSFIKTPEILLEKGYSYLKIVGFSLIFQGIMTSFASIFRSFAIVGPIMKISIIINIINLIGSSIVILTPVTLLGKGIEGVANATLLSRIIGAIIYIYLFLKLFKEYKSSIINPKIDLDCLKSIFKLGLPSGMESISYNISQVMLTAIIAGFGTAVVTSKIYAQTTTSFIFTVSSAISLAVPVIVGRLIGRGLKEEASEYGINVLYKGVIAIFIISISIVPFYRPIISLFTNDKSIIGIAISLIILSILLEPARAANSILIAQLNSAGDVRFPVITGMVVTYFLTIPMSFIVGVVLGYGICGVWVVSIIDEWIRATLFYIRWKKGNWKKIDIT